MKPRYPMSFHKGSCTVRLYRAQDRNFYDYFTVSYSTAAGRVRKTFSRFSKARKFAKETVKKLAKGDQAALALTDRAAHEYTGALEALKGTGTTLAVAVEQFTHAHKLLKGESLIHAVQYYVKHRAPKPAVKVEIVVNELLKDRKAEVSGKWFDNLETILARFRDAFPGMISDIEARDVRAFLVKLDVGPRARNNYRATVGQLLSFAKAQGYLAKDHEGIDSIREFTEKDVQADIYTPKQMRDLLSVTPRSLIPFVAISGFAGLRHYEVGRLDWSEINLAERHIEIMAEKAKTGSRRLAPISDNLAAWLAPIAKASGRVCRKVDMGNEVVEIATKDGAPEWKRNGLRKSFISYRLAIVKDAAKVAHEAGNSAQIVHRNYNKLSTERDALEWFSIMPKTA